MFVQLYVISKLCSEILDEHQIDLENVRLNILEDLHDEIHRLYPGLKEDEHYSLFYRYAENELHSIVNYVSFVAFLFIPFHKIVFLLLKDFGNEPWFDNINLLEKLDRIEAKEQKERERDIYDVKIRKPGEESEEEDDSLDDVEPEVQRTNVDVIKFALRNKPTMTVFTSEAQIRTEYIRVLTKGWPPVKSKPIPVDEEIVFKNELSKDKKGKKGKKGAKSKKSK